MTKTIKIKERKLTGSQDLRDKKPLDCPTGLYAYGQEARTRPGNDTFCKMDNLSIFFS